MRYWQHKMDSSGAFSVIEVQWQVRLSRRDKQRLLRSDVSHTFATIAALVFEQLPRNNHIHDLVGALQDLVHAHVPQIALNRVILRANSEPSMRAEVRPLAGQFTLR